MARGWRLFDRLLDLTGAVASLLIALVFVAIVSDVLARTAGLGSLTWVVGVTEYALLYITTLGAPWLLRERGHVSMEVFRSLMPERMAWIAEKIVCVLCILACLVAIYAGIPAAINAWGTLDERSIYMPRGLLFVPVLIGLALLAVQFARVLTGRGTIYSGLSFDQDGL